MEAGKAAEVMFWQRRDNQLSFAHTGVGKSRFTVINA